MEILEQIGLTRADGTPLTGLPNLAGEPGLAYADEEPVDSPVTRWNWIPWAPTWKALSWPRTARLDGGRVSARHLSLHAKGALAARYVPAESNSEETGVAVGEEALPASMPNAAPT